MRVLGNTLVWLTIGSMIVFACYISMPDPAEARTGASDPGEHNHGHHKNCPVCKVMASIREPFGDEKAREVQILLADLQAKRRANDARIGASLERSGK